MEHLPPLILASRSPRRRELLSRLTEAFRAETSDFDEAPLMAASLSPEDLVLALSEGKARSVLARPDTPAEAVVIGGDTVVVSPDGGIFGIPKDPADAARMLRALSGRTHRVITGVSLVRKDALRRFSVTTGWNSTPFPMIPSAGTWPPASPSTKPEPTASRAREPFWSGASPGTTATWWASPWRSWPGSSPISAKILKFTKNPLYNPPGQGIIKDGMA